MLAGSRRSKRGASKKPAPRHKKPPKATGKPRSDDTREEL